ncbi:MAG: HAMP domain-containing protein, partial [Spirochaetaceae bacterium]
MLKNIKLGTKIGLGFGLVLIIAAAIGVYAFLMMLQISQDSEALAEGYVPEWVLAGQVAERQYSAGYYAVAYSFNFDETWLRNSQQEIAELLSILRRGRAEAQQSVHQQDVLPLLDELIRQAEAYRVAVERTGQVGGRTLAARQAIRQTGEVFERQITAYVDAQSAEMYRQIDRGDSAAELRIRLDRISAGNDVLDLGNRILINTWLAETYLDNAGVRQAAAEANRLIAMIDDLVRVTRQQVNLQQLAAVRQAVVDYSAAVNALSTAAAEGQEVRTQRLEAYNSVLRLADEFVDDAARNATRVAVASMERVGGTVVVLMVGLLLALVLGIAIAVVITRGITKPVSEGVEFARRIALGELDVELTVEQKDEIGVLADALRGMLKSLQYKAHLVER